MDSTYSWIDGEGHSVEIKDMVYVFSYENGVWRCVARVWNANHKPWLF